MSLGIPLPGADRDGLFQGLLHGNQTRQQQQQLQQQWQQHLQNLAVNQAQEQRLGGQFEMEKELHPYKLQQGEQDKQSGPLKLDLLRKQIEYEQQKSELIKRGGSQRVTAAIQEADMLYDRDDPRHSLYILNKSKQVMPNENQLKQDEEFKSSPEYAKIAPHLENAVDLNPLPVASQHFYRKQAHEELGQIDKAKQVKHAISKARGIVKDNPDLYKKAINIIANPDATPGVIEKSLTAILPKKDVEAFAGLAKLYADILTKQAQLNNMSRSVYALRLQQQAKAQVKNPDEVNEQIFKNIEHEIEPQIDREKAILYALKHNQYLPFTKNYSLDEGQPNQVPGQVYSPTSMGRMKGVINGEEIDVEPEDREDFIASGGKIV